MKKLRILAAGALAVGLITVAPEAFAQVEPGGWKPVNPSFKVQTTGCVSLTDGGSTFSITCAKKAARVERRYATYSGGSHQFEGFFRITSMGGARVSLKQTFKTSGPYFLLAVDRGGRLYAVGGKTIASGATVGATVRVNTVHDVGKQLRVYINGSLVYSVKSPSGSFYDKIGAYKTASGTGPITVVWSDVQFWEK
jgi:hypothetical protein